MTDPLTPEEEAYVQQMLPEHQNNVRDLIQQGKLKLRHVNYRIQSSEFDMLSPDLEAFIREKVRHLALQFQIFDFNITVTRTFLHFAFEDESVRIYLPDPKRNKAVLFVVEGYGICLTTEADLNVIMQYYDTHKTFQKEWFSPFSPNYTDGDAYDTFVAFHLAEEKATSFKESYYDPGDLASN